MDNSYNNCDTMEKDLIILEKDINNTIVNIFKKKFFLENNYLNKNFLIKIIKDLSEKNLNIKYIFKFNILNNLLELSDNDNINYNIKIIDSIKDIYFDDSKDYFNELDSLIFVVEKIEKKEFFIMKKKNKKNGTKKLQFKK